MNTPTVSHTSAGSIEATDIQFLPGVGPARKKILSTELGINTYGDMLMNFPYKYVDRSRVYTVRELTGEMPFVQICGRILSFETFDMGPRKERVVAHFSDGTGGFSFVSNSQYSIYFTHFTMRASFSGGSPSLIYSISMRCPLLASLSKSSPSCFSKKLFASSINASNSSTFCGLT